ncbi:MAG TPA: hypothetical protein VMH39_04015 [Gemmatimonadaceae bacterium]|nr:hypothetical protein [Gemmatimonadaceae bacterium]
MVLNPIVLVDDWTVTSDGVIALVRAQDYHIDWIDPSGRRTASPKLPIGLHRLSDSEKVAIVDTMRAFAEAYPLTGVAGVNGRGVKYTVVNDVIDAADVADYVAPFMARTAMADAEGNVWLRPTPEWVPPGPPRQTDAPTIYDVVNPSDGLIDRVQVPSGLSIVGFAPDVVYLAAREGTGAFLMRVQIR